jgi:hypothetical protein
METLVLFAVVSQSGCCLNLSGRKEDMDRAAELLPGSEVEEWTYLLLPDGSHGAPARRRLSRE